VSSADAGGPAVDVPVAPLAVTRRPMRRRGVVDVVLVVAAVFAIGGIGFAAGRVTAPAAQATTGRFGGGGQLPGAIGNGGTNGGTNAQGGTGQRGLGGAFGGAGFTITGQVTELTSDHLTLKLSSGQTIQIPVDSTTAYHTQAVATASDVTTGSTVEVQVSRGTSATGTGNGGTGNGGTGTNGFGGGRLTLGPASSVTVLPK
jgi:hypothetical protein